MRKLIQGIVEFRQNVQEGYRLAFGKLATGQSPDTLFIACSDSRVVPNVFASTNPGDLFVIRNVGNLIPPCNEHGVSTSDESEVAAIEFSTQILNVVNIVVCGHSDCGAMRSILDDREKLREVHLKKWLRHGDKALLRLENGAALDASLAPHNQLSQLNVLLQMEHITSYPLINERIKNGSLHVHGWWFDIAKADVYAYESDLGRFVLIDEEEASRILAKLE